MSDWSLEIEFLAKKLGMGAAGAVRAIRSALDDDPFEVLAYRGYGNGVTAHVYGRVVERSDTEQKLRFGSHQPAEHVPAR
jgi:hypothetical protein